MDTNPMLAALIETPAHAPLADCVILADHGQGALFRGREAVRPVLRAYFGNGFANGRMQLEATVVSGDAAVLLFTFCGRQTGTFLGLPATGREVAVPMALYYRHASGQLDYLAWYYDAGTILRQLCLIP